MSARFCLEAWTAANMAELKWHAGNGEEFPNQIQLNNLSYLTLMIFILEFRRGSPQAKPILPDLQLPKQKIQIRVQKFLSQTGLCPPVNNLNFAVWAFRRSPFNCPNVQCPSSCPYCVYSCQSFTVLNNHKKYSHKLEFEVERLQKMKERIRLPPTDWFSEQQTDKLVQTMDQRR